MTKSFPRMPAVVTTFGVVFAIFCHNSRGEEIFSANEQRKSVAGGTTESAQGGGGGNTAVLLEGGWEAYDATALTVKRSITVERDGDIYQAKVFTPVLTRRGAVFLNREQIGEMLSIKTAMEELVKEVALIQEKAKGLEGRYATLIGQARRAMLETYPTEQHRGKVELVTP